MCLVDLSMSTCLGNRLSPEQRYEEGSGGS